MFLLHGSLQEEELLAKLELELEIQDKICKAATKLIKDNSVNKTARKQRRQSYHRAHQKVCRNSCTNENEPHVVNHLLDCIICHFIFLGSSKWCIHIYLNKCFKAK